MFGASSAQLKYVPPKPSDLVVAERWVTEATRAVGAGEPLRSQLLSLTKLGGFKGSRSEKSAIAKDPDGALAMRPWRWLTDTLALDGVSREFALRVSFQFSWHVDHIGPRMDLDDLINGFPPLPNRMTIAAFADRALPLIAGSPRSYVVVQNSQRAVTAGDVMMRIAVYAHHNPDLVSPSALEIVSNLAALEDV